MKPTKYTVKVTRKEFLEIPLSIRRKAMKSQCDIFIFRKALDALACALAKHNHRWTQEEREMYELAMSNDWHSKPTTRKKSE